MNELLSMLLSNVIVDEVWYSGDLDEWIYQVIILRNDGEYFQLFSNIDQALFLKKIDKDTEKIKEILKNGYKQYGGQDG